MPTCYCISQGCSVQGGREVDRRTLKNHEVKDRLMQAEQARKLSEQVVEAEIEAIRGHLAAVDISSEANATDDIQSIALQLASATLSDSIPPLPVDETHGFWTQEKEQVPDGPPWDTKSSSRQDVIRNLLSYISELDSSLDSLRISLVADIERLSAHPFNDPSFPFVRHQKECIRIQTQLSKVTFKSPAVLTMKRNVLLKTDEIQKLIQQNKPPLGPSPITATVEDTASHYSTDRFFRPFLSRLDPIVQLIIFFILASQTLLGVSRAGGTFMLEMVQYIVQLCFMKFVPNLSMRERKLLSDLPADPRSIQNALQSEPETVIYAVCPNDKYQATYAPKFKEGSPVPNYPSRCRQKNVGMKCRERLLRPRTIHDHVIYTPIKPFVYFSPQAWLGRLLAWPGIEAEMDAAWTNVAPGQNSNSKIMHDIFDGEIIRHFKGPDGRHFGKGGDEGRYVFSLSADFFNPLGNKQAGKKISVGVITLVCLNLPPHLRYKPENMFLAGVIPGPHEPPLTAINHFLKPLVNDFLQLWTTGVLLSKTDSRPCGRLVRCAIICVVCDLPAARKIAGFAAPTHSQFCAICRCNLQVHGFDHLDCESWVRRSNWDCRRSAKHFHRVSHHAKKSKAAVDESGVRWSELLRLPYFDPSRFVVVDAMHNLLLGLVHEHFDGILGLRGVEDSKDLPVLHIPTDGLYDGLQKPQEASLKKMIKRLELPMTDDLRTSTGWATQLEWFSTERMVSLQRLSARLLFVPIGSDYRKIRNWHRADYARGLLTWRLRQREEDYTSAGHVICRDELQAIRNDIVNMLRPSWFTSVPANLGVAAHGKLKADQWRALGTTILPISLARLWSDASPKRQKILDLTLQLVSAVQIAASRTTSPSHAALYHHHMTAYLRGLKEHFPEYSFRPNHHAALHLSEYIRFYGPVHSWWTFPFERVIGMLQRISNNYKPGEYESTIATSFVHANNLRTVLQMTATPEVIRNCEPIFEKLVRPEVRNTLVTDILNLSSWMSTDGDDTSGHAEPSEAEEVSSAKKILPEPLRACVELSFQETAGFLLSHLVVDGTRYSVFKSHAGNASILLRSNNPKCHLPAQIEYIVQIPTKDGNQLVTRIAARPRLPASLTRDPYKAYPFLQAGLWSTKLGPLQLYSANDIVTHCAILPVCYGGQDLIVAISLARDIAV